jgi:hypothetical protein
MLPTVMMDADSIMAETTNATTKRTLITKNPSANVEASLEKADIESSDKSQDELSSMLRLVIANFCEQHFVKQIQKAKLQSTNSNATTTATTIQENNINTTTIQSNTNNQTKLNEQETNEDKQMDEAKPSTPLEETSEESVKKSLDNDNTNNNTNNNANGDTPPPSSSSPSSSSSSDIAMNCESDSSSPLVAKSNANNVKSLDDSITKPEMTADKKPEVTREITSSTDTIHNNHEDDDHDQRHRRLLQIDDDYLIPPSSKLWSTLLIGADKLEIFGSIHVRTNNVRLLSCLIDEQLSIDSNSDSSLSYSSAASISSSGGGDLCSSAKLMMMNKLSHHKFVTNGGASAVRLMTDAALKQVNVDLASRRANYNSTRHHHHHHNNHRNHYKRSRRYRNHNNHSQSHYVRENIQRCCQVNSLYSNRKLESNSTTITNKNNPNSQIIMGMGGSSRRKSTHLFAAPRNVYTDSEQNEYIDEEEPNKLISKESGGNGNASGAINLENDHVIINNNGESAEAASACFDIDEYENEVFDEEDVQDEYGHFNLKKKSKKLASSIVGKSDVDVRAKMNDETNNLEGNILSKMIN